MTTSKHIFPAPFCSASRNLWLTLVFTLAASTALAGTAYWTAGGANTNWSTGGNWIGGAGTAGALANGDQVIFTNAGVAVSAGVISNVVDTGFSISSLRYSPTNRGTYQNTLILPGITLSITNNNGPSSSALYVGTTNDPGFALTNFAVISGGGGATLLITNNNSNILVGQGGTIDTALTQRGTLDLSGLDYFTATVSRLGVGARQTFTTAAIVDDTVGSMYLAKTNNITIKFVPTSNFYTNNVTTSYPLVVGDTSNAGKGGFNYLFLGLTNAIFADGLAFGTYKSGSGAAASGGAMLFNPAFIGSNPTAYFRNIDGVSRISMWSIGDENGQGGSNPDAGTNDFTGGTVNILVNQISMARDANNEGSGQIQRSWLTFNAGIINANIVTVGNQSAVTAGANQGPSTAWVNVNGANATLVVNTNLELGHTTLAAGVGLVANTSGNLNINNGAVYANNISVGAVSITNVIHMNGGTLIVSNTLATNATGLFTLAMTNSTLGLTVSANGSLRGLVKTLTTAGLTNVIRLDAAPVFFSSYPQQLALLKYTTWTSPNNFGLTNVPAWAVGAVLVSNGPNSSLDVLLPADPRPVFTTQPSPYSGSPGDTVTASFAVSIATASVTPLGYQWYYAITGVSTNLLADGPGPSGLSTLSGSASANLQMANAQAGDNGNYFVVVTNAFGTNASSQALLTISAGAITPAVTGPSTQTATNGVTTAIADAVSGSPVPVVYWQFNGVTLANGPGPSGSSAISGSSSATLIISNPQYPGDQGTYSLIASNSAGLATNSTMLTVIVPPTITVQPVNTVVTNTQAASLTVTATGVPAPTYQWNKNGSPISSALNTTATNATFTIGSVSPGDTSSNYSVTISNPAGATNSAIVSLIVNSTMSAISLSPANSATGICYDTPLAITFSQPPVLRTAGTVKIFNATNPVTPVDTINLGLGSPQGRTFAGDSQGFNLYPVIITGNTAVIYPHSSVMTSNQTYYVTVDNGVFVDASGAYFAGITDTNAWRFTTKVGGPANPTSLVVAPDGSGDFLTVQGAVDSLPSANTTPRLINIHDGNYVEVVDISGKNNVTFRGQSRAGTSVGYANNAGIAPGGTTHARMAFKVNANNIAIENMTVLNRTPQGGAQAEALMIESGASRFILNNAEVDSRQDTILANVNSSQGYFYNSLVQGNFDYIWGGGNLFFTNCEIRTIAGTGTPNLAAPRTDNGVTGNWPGYSGLLVSNGISFVSCQLTRQSGVTNCSMSDANGSPNGLAAWINCSFDTAAYTNATSAAYTTQLLWEYGCSNLNNTVALDNTAGPFIGFTQLNNGDPKLLAAQSATNWLNGWQPVLAPNIISQPGNQTVSAGQLASFNVAATGIPNPTYQWLKNGTLISGATSSAFTIPSAARIHAGSYSVVVNNGSGSVTSSVATLAYSGNVAPLANATSFVIAAGYSFKISLSSLSTNWSDADGDAIALTATISSTNGAAVSYDSNYVYYSNSNGVNDQINYTVGDGQGGTGAGIVNLTVSTNPIAGTPQSIIVTGSSATLNLAGIPSYQYEVQRSTNLLDWVTLLTTNAPANGLFNFTDSFLDLGGVPPVTAFYRTAQP